MFWFAVSILIIANVIFVSCVPKPDGTSKQNTSNSRTERTNNRVAEKDSKTNANETAKSKETAQNNTATKGRKSREEAKNESPAVKEVPKYSEKVKNTKNNNAAANNPFERRKNALKNITNENERFSIDTTYYILTMENGNTIKTSDINLVTGGTPTNIREHRDNLVLSFIENIEKSEKSEMFDCMIFKAFASQFTFSDSLRQEADFYYAECCIGNNNLEEAQFVLETMSKEKLNKGVAPKVLVRLGQLCCVAGDTQQAEKYFKRLKKEHPRSIYTQLADCSRL